jgi:CRP/FNR family transcriptional regulator
MQNIAESVLGAYAFYRDGSPELRAELLKYSRVVDREHLAGDHLFSVGDVCDSIHLVGNGGIRVYVSGMSGRGILLYEVRVGEICPLNTRMVLSGSVALANAAASGDLVAVRLYRDAVRDMSGKFDEFRHFLQQAVLERFEEIIVRISDITTRRVDHRLVDVLLEEFDREGGERPTIEMTNDEIALAVGAAREVVNRKLHEFERIGAVRLGRGRIWLQDKDALRVLSKPKQKNQ